MNRGKNLKLIIPTVLIIEIFSRLPSKSIARFLSVSKLWGSMLRSPYFNELFKTRSSARPRLLLAVQSIDDGEWLFYSAPQPQNPYEKSLVVATDFHTKFRGRMYRDGFCSNDSGLINFYDMLPSKESRLMICNPITGQYTILPEYLRDNGEYSLLGFDPIDKQFKVLLMDNNMVYNERVHQILTLGTDKVKWRNIQCPLIHTPFLQWVCINGTLYYFADQYDDENSNLIVCFDVRYEKFKFIDIEFFPDLHGVKLINYKGKLCGIFLKYGNNNTLELYMWVLEDVEKQEWWEYVYMLLVYEGVDFCYLSVNGVTATGEIVLSKWYIEKQFYVFYFNPERNTLQHVEIQGLGVELKHPHPHAVYTFVDHVEDLSFNDAKNLMNSSIYAPSMKKKACSLNTIKERPKPHHRNRDRRYHDDGKFREKKQRERRNERERREDEDRRRRRRNREEMIDRERCVERKRDRDNRWSDKECKRKKREKGYERRDR